jgi:hypothetical protein
MWRISLVVIAIGSLITGNIFALPLNAKDMLEKNHLVASSPISNKHAKNSSFKFNGTWAGICHYSNPSETEEAKIEIYEDNATLSIRNYNTAREKEVYIFDVIRSGSYSSKGAYLQACNKQ